MCLVTPNYICETFLKFRVSKNEFHASNKASIFLFFAASFFYYFYFLEAFNMISLVSRFENLNKYLP